ncbi:MAG TPA: Hsp20/alpha crystallin family protein [Solirubrobacteraceae bacterium]|jgi:HSP20 family protein|nr:Hsp20/alpha crystallin family protein [Solirubrobacteraceae bacterium]
MATTMVEPITPWLRELGQVLHDRGTVGAFMPPADLLIDDDGVTVYMDVPGLHPDNLQIELENDVLTVSGERPFPYAREDGAVGQVQRIERGFGRFQRSIRVPSGLNPEAIEASLHDGVLTLRIPKPETMRPRRIEIRGDADGSGTAGGDTGSSEPGSANP